MYCTFEEVRPLIKEDCIRHIIGDPYEMEQFEIDAKLEELINSAIKDAEAEVNGYLAVRYRVPLALPPPGIINKITKDIALYNLFCRMDEDTAKPYLERYNAAIKFLLNVSKGTADIGITNISNEYVQSGKFTVNSAGRMFSRNSLKGM